ncbi:MAG TPA: SMP-30/gluconolactonase/LRE family protein [Candidatus Binatia bacterium]|jgi:gluconolactonase|nr:SMP-30/gluconolactonase/LRE family protein [Candidatus Binatia bacterium]
MKTFPPAILLPVLVASFCAPLRAADDYQLGPDSQLQPGVPHGKIEKFTFASNKIFPGTVRDYWVYVPAQYDAARPACLMVFQDGGGYVTTNGSWRVPIVFDNLIARKEMPVTIGLFINPGVVPAANSNALPRFNRSLEYDGLGDHYVRFLLEEILPEVTKRWNLAPDAGSRAIAGASSGAICAFTAAWERPDAFGRVLSTIGTYTGLRGGNNYPILIRKTEPKPIRVFLQDGSGDLNIYGGNWWLANQEMLSALEFAGYEVNHIWGDGGHTGKQGASILPDALRWLWKDYPAPVRAGTGSRQPIMDLLLPGEGWHTVAGGFRFTEGPAVNAKGEVFFTDIPNNRIHKIGLDGKVSVFLENSGGANGMMFGPDGRLYVCQNGRKQILALDSDAKEAVVAEEISSNDLCVDPHGNMFVSDPPHRQVWRITPTGEKRVVDTGITLPNGVRFTPDQSLLLVDDTRGQFVYSFQVQPDGSLTNKQAYFHLHLPDGAVESGADGMALDTQGRLYVATRVGLQVCDQAGRVTGIIPKPQDQWLSNVVFGGPGFDELYVTCGDKVFKRKIKARGVLSWQPPLKPVAPKL